MRTDKEFAQEALRRAAAIRRKCEARKRRVAAICSAAASLSAIAGLSFLLPKEGAAPALPEGVYGASLFADGSIGGYVIIGVVGFALGVAVALFCRRRNKGD